jgi:hypothetical protein
MIQQRKSIMRLKTSIDFYICFVVLANVFCLKQMILYQFSV